MSTRVRECRRSGCGRLAFRGSRYWCIICEAGEEGHTDGCDRRQDDPHDFAFGAEPAQFFPVPRHWPAGARHVIAGTRVVFWARCMAWAMSGIIENLDGRERSDFIRDALALFDPTRVPVEGASAVSTCLAAWRDV
eukprot:s5419_g5.t1